MSTNVELARIFSEMAAGIELLGGNSFKASSHQRVARVLKEITVDVATIADDKKKLLAIEGIGEGSAKKIIEYVQTGHVKEHDELLETVPVGLFQLLKIPGLGPKSIKAIWDIAGVTDLASLQAKVETGELEKVPRLGKKTIENIAASIAFVETTTTRTRIGDAMPLAEEMVEAIARVKGVTQVAYAGSLRRGAETIGDIDILTTTTDRTMLAKVFCERGDVEKIIGRGETKCSIRLNRGLQVDLRMLDEESFGAALLYFTGSKQHNVRLRERAIKRKMRLNEYGLFPLDEDDLPPQQRGVKPIASKREEDIYKALGLPWIPPELREDRGEFGDTLPKLIEFDDIKAELHAHTLASDGKFTIDELAAEAISRGFHTIAVTDHSQSSALAGGLEPDRLRQHIQTVREANERIKDITILAGSEVDISPEGLLDYEDDLLAQLDIVIASPHASLRQDSDRATKRLVAAVKHPLVHILGHPTGRIINKREGLSPNIERVIEAAAEARTALEINANYYRLDLRDSHVRAAVDAGAMIAINCDAHTVHDFEMLRYGVMTGRRGWLTAKQCVNTWTSAKLMKWLKSKR